MDLQPLLYIGVPAILILAGMFFNWSAANGIRSEIKDVRSEIKDVRAEIKDVRSEIKDVRSEVGDVRSEVRDLYGKLEDVKDSNHRDALEIMRQMTALHERVAIVESKQK